jgi:hypothetical protein
LTSNARGGIVDFDILGMSAPALPGWDIRGSAGSLSFYHRAADEGIVFFGKSGFET